MPIRPDLKHYYQGPEWRAQRAETLRLAGNKCQQCGKPGWDKKGNPTLVLTFSWHDPEGHHMAWSDARKVVPEWFDERGRPFPWRHVRPRGATPIRGVKVVLTTAHLNHDPADRRTENRMCLCQWCHLNYDKMHHKETRSIRKDATRPLLAPGNEEAGVLS